MTTPAVLASLRDRVRTQLWPIPAAGVVLALALGIWLPRVDGRWDDRLPGALTSYLFTGGPGSARNVLDSVAGSLITVTSLTFSLTVVTLQLASSQFSPRLLRTFSRDLVVQSTLALFLGTFTYALTVLRTVRSADEAGPEFVPDLAVTFAFVLAIVSVIGLVLFLAHLAQTIRVESMLRRVHQDASAVVAREPAGGADSPPTLASLLPTGEMVHVRADESGFVVAVDEEDLLNAARDASAVVVLDCGPGSWVVAGTPIAAAWPRRGMTVDQVDAPALATAVRKAVTIGFERTDGQDLSFGLRQLTDVAVKALSPGINDPTTAVHALGHSAALLCELATCELGPRILRDETGVMHAAFVRPDLGDLLALAVEQPARYGVTEPAVLSRLFALLRELAWCCRPGQREEVAVQLAWLRVCVANSDLGSAERGGLDLAAGLVDDALAGRWLPGNRDR